MTSHTPLGVPYDSVVAGKPPNYRESTPMTRIRQAGLKRQADPGFDAEAMPYRPRERPTEKAFRQLCCGSCWGLCAWVAVILAILTSAIIGTVVAVAVSTRIDLGAF